MYLVSSFLALPLENSEQFSRDFWLYRLFDLPFFQFSKKVFFSILTYRNSRSQTFFKICVPANIEKILRTTFFIKHLRWLLLKLGIFVLYIYAMYCLQHLLKCFTPSAKYIIFKILPCCYNIYLLPDVSLVKWPSSLTKFSKRYLHHWESHIYCAYIYLTWDKDMTSFDLKFNEKF